MNNIIEYKNWLFVTVPEDAITFRHGIYAVHCYNSSDESPENDKSVFIGVQYSSYQIIGKGDQVSMEQWEEIVDSYVAVSDVGYYSELWFKDYSDVQQIIGKDYNLIDADISGHSLLKSLGMEPGTTLVLKKNEK